MLPFKNIYFSRVHPAKAILFLFVVVCGSVFLSLSVAKSTNKKQSKPSVSEIQAIATEAYIYLYPLVTMEFTRRISTNSPVGKVPGRGPMNTVVNMREFPDAKFKDVIRPNFDTLYSIIWMDLSKEPLVLSVGDSNGRYYLLPMLDMWSNVFAVPGKRTSGTQSKSYLIAKQGWSGDLPQGLQMITAPTSLVWMIGRIKTNGPLDYPAVNQLQDTIQITALTDWKDGKSSPVNFTFDSSVDMKTPPLDQVNQMSAAEYFELAAELIKQNPPQITDWSILERMKKIGFVAGQSFDFSSQTPEVQDSLVQGSKLGLGEMARKVPTLARVVNGWQMNTDTMGVYGNYYLKRAIVAMVGLGANQPEDAIYPMAVSDIDGQPIVGDQNYVLHFDKSELPPVNAFWSVTMYDEQGFPVANEINRFAIGDRDHLKYNSDGSLDIYIQNRNPGGDKTSNWLPAPAKGKTGVTMRLYSPSPEVLDGRWNPPGIKKN